MGESGPEDAAEEEGKAPAREEMQPAGPREIRPPRFPVGRIAIALAGIALAVWLWLGSSYAWSVTPTDLLEGKPPLGFRGGWTGRYVRLRADMGGELRYDIHPETSVGVALAYEKLREDRNVFFAFELAPAKRIAESAARSEGSVTLSGRVVTASYLGVEGDDLVVDATRGRWTGRSFLAIFMGLWGAAIGVVAVLVWRARLRAIPAAACVGDSE